jgi:hypothetical protein
MDWLILVELLDAIMPVLLRFAETQVSLLQQFFRFGADRPSATARAMLRVMLVD